MVHSFLSLSPSLPPSTTFRNFGRRYPLLESCLTSCHSSSNPLLVESLILGDIIRMHKQREITALDCPRLLDEGRNGGDRWLTYSYNKFLALVYDVSRHLLVSRLGLAVSRRTSVRYRFGSPFSSKGLWFVDTVFWLCPSQLMKH